MLSKEAFRSESPIVGHQSQSFLVLIIFGYDRAVEIPR